MCCRATSLGNRVLQFLSALAVAAAGVAAQTCCNEPKGGGEGYTQLSFVSDIRTPLDY
jgi:hypothetical protein